MVTAGVLLGARRGDAGPVSAVPTAQPVPVTWEHRGRSLPRGALGPEAGLGVSRGLVTPCSE